MIDFPITAEAVYSVFGLAFALAVLVQIVKLFVEDKRTLNLVAIGAGVLIAALAMLVMTDFKPTGQQCFSAGMIALFAIAIATLGYETVTNIAGLVGYGPKSDKARVSAARELLNRNM